MSCVRSIRVAAFLSAAACAPTLTAMAGDNTPYHRVAVDWYGGGPNGDPAQGPMGPQEVAGVAGVAQIAQANWNSLTGEAGSAMGGELVDNEGQNASIFRLSWQGAGLGDTNIPDEPGDSRMMLGYLDLGAAGSVLFDHRNVYFDQSNGYYLYVYADGDNGGDTWTVTYTGRYTDREGTPLPGATVRSAVLVDPADTDFGGRYVQGTNYVRLGPFFGSDPVMLQGIPGPGTPQVPVNGIQFVAVLPEPAGGLALLGLLGVAATTRRRQRA